MRPKPEWVRELKARCGSEYDLYWNPQVGRWAVKVPCVDGQTRDQFWCWFRDPHTGEKLEADQFGLLPFRDLDDESFRELLRNLDASYLCNPYDGPGSARKQLAQRQQWNDEQKAKSRKERAAAFVDMVGDRIGRMRGRAFSAGGIEVVSPIGSKEA